MQGSVWRVLVDKVKGGVCTSRTSARDCAGVSETLAAIHAPWHIEWSVRVGCGLRWRRLPVHAWFRGCDFIFLRHFEFDL